MRPSRHIARLAASHGGVVTRVQLRAAGMTDHQIDGWIAAGILHPLFRGVYAFGNPNVNDIAFMRAALLSCRPDAFLSHETGRAALGLRRLYRRGIEVTVPGAGRHARKDLTVHRTRHLDPGDVTTRDGLRVCTFPRLLVDKAGTASVAQLEDLITLGVRKNLFDPLAVEAAIARSPRRPGMEILKAGAARYRPGPDRSSELELDFDRWKVTRPDIPDPERNVHVDIWEIDRLWREQGIALELDGRPYHIAVRDFDKDSRKNNALLVMGLKPVRVSDFRWEYDRPQVICDLESLLGLTPR